MRLYALPIKHTPVGMAIYVAIDPVIFTWILFHCTTCLVCGFESLKCVYTKKPYIRTNYKPDTSETIMAGAIK